MNSLTWSVAPGLVVRREDPQMAASYKVFIVQSKQRVSRVQKLWMEYHLKKNDCFLQKDFQVAAMCVFCLSFRMRLCQVCVLQDSLFHTSRKLAKRRGVFQRDLKCIVSQSNAVLKSVWIALTTILNSRLVGQRTTT